MAEGKKKKGATKKSEEKAAKWWIYSNSRKEAYGPVDLATLQMWLDEGRISAQDRVAEVGSDNWVRLEQSGLFKRCNKCGVTISGTASFCLKCGAPVDGVEKATAKTEKLPTATPSATTSVTETASAVEVAKQPEKKTRKKINKKILIPVAAVIFSILLLLVGGTLYALVVRNGKIKEVDAKLVKMDKTKKKVDKDTSAARDRWKEVGEKADQANEAAEGARNQEDQVDQKEIELQQNTDNWNARRRVSYSASLVNRTNALVSEHNTLKEQADAQLAQLDSLSSQGALLESEVESMQDDADAAKAALDSAYKGYSKQVKSIDSKRKQLSVFTLSFREIISFINTHLKKLKVNSVEREAKSVNSEADACDLKVNELNANIEQRRALHQEVVAKQARMSDIYNSLNQIWP